MRIKNSFFEQSLIIVTQHYVHKIANKRNINKFLLKVIFVIDTLSEIKLSFGIERANNRKVNLRLHENQDLSDNTH